MQRSRTALLVTFAAAAVAALAPVSAAVAAPAGKPRTVKLWFVTGEQFRTVNRDVKASDSTTISSVKELLKGPRKAERDDDFDSAIPKGVTLTQLVVAKDGTATVKMSPGFLKDIATDPAARTSDQQIKLKARLGQLTYTVTQFKHIKKAVVFAGAVSLSDSDRGDFAKPSTGPKPIVVDPGQAVAGTTEVQQSLAKLKYLPDDAVDGKLGYRTTQAIIAFQSWEGLGRDGVVGPATSARLKTASTPKPKGSGRRIEVYRDKGVTLLVSGGKTLRAIHTSSGAPGYATPTGAYKVFRKELKSWSVPYSVWLPYASYFNNGIAFHEWADIPTYPASHGCVRVAAPEAPRVYEFATNGTTVNVY